MMIFGMSIGEIATLIGLGSSFVGGLMYLFKTIIIAPLSLSIKDLQRTIEDFSSQMVESKNDRKSLRNDIDSLRLKMTEKSTSYEEKFKTVFNALEKLESKGE